MNIEKFEKKIKILHKCNKNIHSYHFLFWFSSLFQLNREFMAVNFKFIRFYNISILRLSLPIVVTWGRLQSLLSKWRARVSYIHTQALYRWQTLYVRNAHTHVCKPTSCTFVHNTQTSSLSFYAYILHCFGFLFLLSFVVLSCVTINNSLLFCTLRSICFFKFFVKIFFIAFTQF